MRNIFSVETVRVQNEARRGIFLFGRLVYIGKKPLYYIRVRRNPPAKQHL